MTTTATSEPSPVLCGLAYTDGFSAKWTWYVGEEFGRELHDRRAKALDALDGALLARVQAMNDWAMGPDVDLKAWLKARGRLAELPVPKAENKPKPRAKAKGRR